MALTIAELTEVTATRALLRSGAAREIREAAGATQSEVAQSAGCTWAALSKYESGTRSPRNPQLALRLAAAYRELATVTAVTSDLR